MEGLVQWADKRAPIGTLLYTHPSASAAAQPLTDDEINWHYADSDLQPQLYDKRGMFEAGANWGVRAFAEKNGIRLAAQPGEAE